MSDKTQLLVIPCPHRHPNCNGHIIEIRVSKEGRAYYYPQGHKIV